MCNWPGIASRSCSLTRWTLGSNQSACHTTNTLKTLIAMAAAVHKCRTVLLTGEKHSEPAQARRHSNGGQARCTPERQPLATSAPPAGSTLLPRQQRDRKQNERQRQRMQIAPCSNGISDLQACNQLSQGSKCALPYGHLFCCQSQ